MLGIKSTILPGFSRAPENDHISALMLSIKADSMTMRECPGSSEF
jgi:hypothetical protein